MQHAKLKGNSQRTPLSVPSDQDQRDRQEVRAHDLDPGLVRAGRRKALSLARAWLGHAVVQERSPESVDSVLMREAWRGSDPLRSSMQMVSSLLLRNSATNTG